MPSRGLTFHQEIQDAVAACERLVLVVGPKAALSDYVRQEWQFALQADKAVTPILRHLELSKAGGKVARSHGIGNDGDQISRLMSRAAIPHAALGETDL